MGSQDRNRLAMQAVKRAQLAQSLKSSLEATIDHRISRYLEIEHQGIIGNHHFAPASSECISLYGDGYFISAVMVSQAVNEGIVKLVAQRNGIKGEKHSELVDDLKQKGIISSQCGEASERIRGSFRNDVHHMNPKVASIPFEELAKRNLQDLATVEKEILGVDFKDGKLVPRHPQYWDVAQDGTVPVFLRLDH
jgi:hypothetical protein